MSGLTDVDSPFVKTEKACKICGCSDGNMESMFCDADDSRMLNKIYKCTRVEVTPVCGLISPICESCRKRIEAYDEYAKPKVVEFVIKNEIEDALDYDPFSFQDPMASADPMASTDPMAENFDDISMKLEIEIEDDRSRNSTSNQEKRRGRKSKANVESVIELDEEPVTKKESEQTKECEKENVPKTRDVRKASEKVKVKISSDEDSDFEWQGGEDFGDNDDDDDVKFDDSPNVKSSSEDDIPLKKRKISKVKVKTQKKYKRSAEGNSKLSGTGKRPRGRPRKERPAGFEDRRKSAAEECKICGRVVTYMREHMRQHKIDKQQKCPYCERMFVQGNNLKYHIRKHLGERPYSCNICDKTFYCAPHLKSHMKVHGPQGLFQCEKCPKTFNQEGNLKKHLRVHTGEKPYKCNKCNKAFNSTSNLKNHQRLHSDERAFTCEHCAKSFVDIHHLQRHVRVHTGQRPYFCHICCHAFYCQNGIREHLKTHIPDRQPLKAEKIKLTTITPPSNVPTFINLAPCRIKMFARAAAISRTGMTNLVRYSHSHGGIPGENLPFSLNNRYKLTAIFVAFFGSGLGLPFFVLRHQLLKM
ncbi:zinc finger protein 69 homolog [Culex pipiens pallens]|uniref:zinc finger protein 69 homolog n=1 Tax=Culex pipiens pallens TaxID=42434 RepID=UPI00195402DB|nr:zinc finger protein 69 homolog [Culex pipiens pallens]